MLRRDGGYKVSVDNPGLHQVQRTRVEIIAHAIVVEIVLGALEAGSPQDIFAANALVLEIMNRVTEPRIPHSVKFVDLEEQHWDESGLPIVAVDDIRAAIG